MVMPPSAELSKQADSALTLIGKLAETVTFRESVRVDEASSTLLSVRDKVTTPVGPLITGVLSELDTYASA